MVKTSSNSLCLNPINLFLLKKNAIQYRNYSLLKLIDIVKGIILSDDVSVIGRIGLKTSYLFGTATSEMKIVFEVYLLFV